MSGAKQSNSPKSTTRRTFLKATAVTAAMAARSLCHAPPTRPEATYQDRLDRMRRARRRCGVAVRCAVEPAAN